MPCFEAVNSVHDVAPVWSLKLHFLSFALYLQSDLGDRAPWRQCHITQSHASAEGALPGRANSIVTDSIKVICAVITLFNLCLVSKYLVLHVPLEIVVTRRENEVGAFLLIPVPSLDPYAFACSHMGQELYF